MGPTIERTTGRLLDGLVDGVVGGLFRGLFGRGGGGDNSGELIDIIRQNGADNINNLRALMEQNEKSLNDGMKFYTEYMQITKEENQKIIHELRNEIKKKEEEYEKIKKQKEEKKEQKRKEVNELLINNINESKSLILKECENEFDNLRDSYCFKEIKNISNLAEDIEELFRELFESENIKKIFLNIILGKIKTFKYSKKIDSYNIQIIGKTGVGKSTLINTLLRTDLAETSFGRVGTHETKEYTCKKFPFIKFIDTRGTELSDNNNIYKVEENTLNYIGKKLSGLDPNESIHCLLYCISSNRFEDIESKVLLSLRKKYKNGNLPIIIVYTQSYFKEDFERMKKCVNEKLKENEETEVGDKIEDINFVGIVAKKKENIKPKGLDELLNYLKLKAKSAFIITIINIIKESCKKAVELLLNTTQNNLISNKKIFIEKEKNNDLILYSTLKNIFCSYTQQNNQNLSEKGELILKNAVQKLNSIINNIQKNNLSEFVNEYSEIISSEIDKAQFNVINRNPGVELNIKEYSQFKREGKNDLSKMLEKKSIHYSKINFAQKVYEQTALRFKVLFKEAIEEIIENEKDINDLVINSNQNITEDITNKIDELINEIKSYQDGEID